MDAAIQIFPDSETVSFPLLESTDAGFRQLNITDTATRVDLNCYENPTSVFTSRELGSVKPGMAWLGDT